MLKAIIVYFRKKKEFGYKNNYGYNKSANFCLNNISKINYKTLIVMLYILSELSLRKI